MIVSEAIKKAVEYYKGVWPFGDKEVIIASTDYSDVLGLGCEKYSSYKLSFDVDGLWYEGLEIWKVVCNKQQFEDYVIKEQQMQEAKFKYVNAGIETVGELVDRLLDDEELYNREKKPISYETIYKYELRKLREIVLDRITTRQPLPWYEVEGVFPCLVELKNSAGNSVNDKCLFWGVALYGDSDGVPYIEAGDGSHLEANECKKAAEYGVGYGL